MSKKEDKIKSTHSKLDEDKVSKKFEKMHKVDKEIQALDDDLKKKGFKPLKDKKNFYGFESKHISEEDQQEATVSLYIQDYGKEKSKDGACIGQVLIQAGERSEVYSFSLVAPEGDVKKVKEHKVDRKELKVMEANSWWSCVENYLKKNFAGDILGIIGTCALTSLVAAVFSWAAFLACIATKTGIAFVKASACCGCNCAWWCKWVTGCCYQ